MSDPNDPRNPQYYSRKYSQLRKSIPFPNQLQVFSGDAVLSEHDFMEGNNTRIFAGHIGSFWAPPYYSSHVWRGRKADKQPDSLQTELMLYNRTSGEGIFELPSDFDQATWYPSKLVVSKTYTQIGLNTTLRGAKMALPGRSFALKIELENNDTTPQDINLLFLISLNSLKRMENWYYPVLGWNWNLYPTIDDYRAWYMRTKYQPDGIALFSNNTYQTHFAAAIHPVDISFSYELDNWTIHPSGNRNASIAHYFQDNGWLRDVSRDSPYTRGAAAGLAVEIPQLDPGEKFAATLVMAVSGDQQGALDQIASLRSQTDLEAYSDNHWQEKLVAFVDRIPEIETPNNDLKKIYYNSALTYLLNRWDSFNAIGQASFFGRSTAIFPWLTGDQMILALVEPDLWRDLLLRVIKNLNFRRCRAFQPIGNYLHLCDVWYAASPPAFIQAIYDYIACSGDTDFLDEIANEISGKTMLKVIKELALYRPDNKTSGLVDFGSDRNLYEFNIHCSNNQLIGKYTHKVPSTNAEFVQALMLTSELLALKGEDTTQVDNMAQNVADEITSTMWDANGWNGTGWFNTLRPWENPDPFPAVAVFHLLDIPDLLSDEQRRALMMQLENEYISEEKRFTSLPMSWKDTKWCSRTDWHGPGLYSGEVGLMLTRLFQNERKDLAAQILWDEGGNGTKGYKFLAEIPLSHQAYSHSVTRFPNEMDVCYLEGLSLAQAVLCGIVGISASTTHKSASLGFCPRLPDSPSLFPFVVSHIHLQGSEVGFAASSTQDIQLDFQLGDTVANISFSYTPEEHGHLLRTVFHNVAPDSIFSLRVTGEDGTVNLYHAESNQNGRASFGPIDIQEKSVIEFPYAIGEVGLIEDLTHEKRTVILKHQYQNPIVFAQPPSRNESDPAVIRIVDVQSDQFTLYLHEAPDKDGLHLPEAVSYLVLEAGSWQLDDGARLVAGRIETSATVGHNVQNSWEEINFDIPFSGQPVVITQVQSNQDPHWVKTRQTATDQTGFQVALEEEDVKDTPHGSEVVGWLAIESGSGEWSAHHYEARMTGEIVTQSWENQTFDPPFEQPPFFVAALSSYSGTNNAALRFAADSKSEQGIDIMIEGDTNPDPDTDLLPETVAYLAIESPGSLAAKTWVGDG